MSDMVLIRPDGTWERHDPPGDYLSAAKRLLGSREVDVVTIWHPRLTPNVSADATLLVGIIDEWSLGTQPLNHTAWALHGKTPICGPMVVFADPNDAGVVPPLPAALIGMLEDRTKLLNRRIVETMRAALAQYAHVPWTDPP